MPASLDDILTTQQQGVIALNAIQAYVAAIPGILTPLSPANGGTGVANGALSTITLGGAVTFSGAFTATFTVTANTSVTLPTAGTLATLAGAETLSNKTLTVPKKTSYTVATLPAGAATAEAYVTDSNATLAAGLGNAVVGGGANFVPVYHDGASWRIG